MSEQAMRSDSGGNNGDQVMTIQDVAKYAKVCDQTVRRWCRARRIAFHRVGLGPIRIMRSALDEFMNSIEVKAK